MASRTQMAVQDFIKNDGMTQAEACRKHGITKAALSRALKRIREAKAGRICDCCGQVVTKAFQGLKKVPKKAELSRKTAL